MEIMETIKKNRLVKAAVRVYMAIKKLGEPQYAFIFYTLGVLIIFFLFLHFRGHWYCY